MSTQIMSFQIQHSKIITCSQTQSWSILCTYKRLTIILAGHCAACLNMNAGKTPYLFLVHAFSTHSLPSDSGAAPLETGASNSGTELQPNSKTKLIQPSYTLNQTLKKSQIKLINLKKKSH